jgi:hypothetical protein
LIYKKNEDSSRLRPAYVISCCEMIFICSRREKIALYEEFSERPVASKKANDLLEFPDHFVKFTDVTHKNIT